MHIKKSTLSLVVYILFIFLTFCGCNKKQEEEVTDTGWIVGTEKKLIEEMAPDDIIVSVEGVELNRAEYEEMLGQISTRFKLQRNANPSMLKVYLTAQSRELVNQFVNRQLLLCEARERNIKVSDSLLNSITDLYRQQAERMKKTLDQLVSDMGDTQDEFKKRVYERALIQTLIKEEFGDSLKVTPEDVEAEKKRYADYNAMCNATNKLLVAQGKEIMAKLEAGADFKQIIAEYAIEDDEAPDGLWGEFTFAEIDFPEISEAAFAKPIGSVAGPFDTEEGLIIIKILERIKDDNASDQAERVKLERIRLNMGQTMDCPTDAQLEKELVKRKNKEAIQPFLEKLNLKYRVEFPHGIELWKAVDSKSNLLPS